MKKPQRANNPCKAKLGPFKRERDTRSPRSIGWLYAYVPDSKEKDGREISEYTTLLRGPGKGTPTPGGGRGENHGEGQRFAVSYPLGREYPAQQMPPTCVGLSCSSGTLPFLPKTKNKTSKHKIF